MAADTERDVPDEQERVDTGLPEIAAITPEDFAAKLAEKRGLTVEQAEVEDAAAEVEQEEVVAPEPTTEETAAAAEAAADAAEAELPDDATDEERAAAREEAERDFYVLRYRTREEAEAGFREKEELIGRQGLELGEMKKQLEALQAERQAVQEQPKQIDRAAWTEWAEQAVAEGMGAQGALEALSQGGYAGYEVYLREWLSDPEQVAEATLFNNALTLEMSEQRAAAAAAPAIEQQRAVAAADESVVAKQRLLEKRPDLNDYEETMAEILDTLPPERRTWLRQQAESGVEGKETALEWLYLEARLSKASTVAEAAVTERKQRETSAARAKVAATTSTAEGTPTRTPLTEAERKAIALRNRNREAWGLEPLDE
jgi:hypothetical protein